MKLAALRHLPRDARDTLFAVAVFLEKVRLIDNILLEV